MFDKYLRWGSLGALICAKTIIIAGHPSSLELKGSVRPVSSLKVISSESTQQGIVTELTIDNNNLDGYSVALSSSEHQNTADYVVKVVKVSSTQTEEAVLDNASLNTGQTVTQNNPKAASVGARYRVYITNQSAAALSDSLMVKLTDSVGNDQEVEVPFYLPANLN